MKKNRRQNQAGYTIMEILIVLAIVIFLAAIVFGAVHKMSDNAKTNAYISDINTIRSAVTSLYAGKSDYTGLTETVLINSGHVPVHMITNAWPPLVNPWGGGVVVRPSSSRVYFTIDSYHIPKGACVSLVVNAAMSFLLVQVNGIIVRNTNSKMIDVDTVTSACSYSHNNLLFFSN